jgi:hypothetical protein
LINTTLHTKPADGSTHWSVRAVADETGISKASVHRYFKMFGLPGRAGAGEARCAVAVAHCGPASDTAKMPEGRARARVRTKVEHPFRVIKRQLGLVKVRFKGRAKNTAHVITLFALSKLWMARKKLMAMMGQVRPQTA